MNETEKAAAVFEAETALKKQVGSKGVKLYETMVSIVGRDGPVSAETRAMIISNVVMTDRIDKAWQAGDERGAVEEITKYTKVLMLYFVVAEASIAAQLKADNADEVKKAN